MESKGSGGTGTVSCTYRGPSKGATVNFTNGSARCVCRLSIWVAVGIILGKAELPVGPLYGLLRRSLGTCSSISLLIEH